MKVSSLSVCVLFNLTTDLSQWIGWLRREEGDHFSLFSLFARSFSFPPLLHASIARCVRTLAPPHAFYGIKLYQNASVCSQPSWGHVMSNT